MASYMFSTTPEQEALLSWIVATTNAQKNTSFTNAQYVQGRIADLLAPFATAFKESIQKQVQARFESADPATQAEIKSLLGIS